MEKALRIRQPVPVGKGTDPAAVHRRVVADDAPEQVFDQREVQPGAEGFQRAQANLQEPFAVDMHEIPFNVQLQDETRSGIIAGHPADMLLQAEDPVVGSPARNARITVPDESGDQVRGDVTVQQMVHHAVAELRCEHLPHLGVVDDEAGGASRAVRAGQDGVAKALLR